jgi:hypothetical protein
MWVAQKSPPGKEGCIVYPVVLPAGSQALLQFAFVAYCQFVATLGTAASQHFTAVGSLHALTESMNAFAATVVRLECTFHTQFLFAFL